MKYMENLEIYEKTLRDKYVFSEKYYKKKFTNEDSHFFLNILDQLNVYTLYPEPVIYKIHKPKKLIFKNEEQKNYADELKDLVDKKNKEIRNMNYDEETTPFRKFFSAEIGDYIETKFNAEYVSIAWLKIYELLAQFELFKGKDKVRYFGVCEHPGAFIYSINHYVKTQITTDFDFIFQSLKPNKSNKEIFRAEPKLLEKYRDKIDYALGDGDITNLDNIKYYHSTYSNDEKTKKEIKCGDPYKGQFDIVTADCGLDTSEDFTNQELSLIKIYFGAFLTSLGICKKGGCYIQKLFTFYDFKMQELIYLASYYFESVHLVKTLTTKPASGEIYMVCTNFQGCDDYDKLFSYYQNYSSKYSLIKIEDDEFQKIFYFNAIVSLRRLLNVNYLIFRNINKEYYKNIKKIYDMAELQTYHYVKYYCKYYNVKQIEDKDKLVNAKTKKTCSIEE